MLIRVRVGNLNREKCKCARRVETKAETPNYCLLQNGGLMAMLCVTLRMFRLRLRLYIKAIHDELAAITASRHRKIKHGVWVRKHSHTSTAHTLHYKVR